MYRRKYRQYRNGTKCSAFFGVVVGAFSLFILNQYQRTFGGRRICSRRSTTMSTDSFAYSIQAVNGSRSPTARGEVEQQSEETAPPLQGYVTPPPSILIFSTNLDVFRLKRRRTNTYESTSSLPIDRGSIAGAALSNRDFLKTDASISAFSDVPMTKFILATPNQVSMESQHPAIKRPRAVYMVRGDSTSTDSRVYHYNDDILPENRHESISSMFLPVHEGGLEGGSSQEEGTMMTGRCGLRLKPKNLTARGDLFE
jgi:hypothetical protein